MSPTAQIWGLKPLGPQEVGANGTKSLLYYSVLKKITSIVFTLQANVVSAMALCLSVRLEDAEITASITRDLATTETVRVIHINHIVVLTMNDKSHMGCHYNCCNLRVHRVAQFLCHSWSFLIIYTNYMIVCCIMYSHVS